MIVTIASLVAVLTLIGLATTAPALSLSGLVQAVLTLRIRLLHGQRIVPVDGDTIRFRKNRLFGILGYDIVKGRLRGIDAPESSQSEGAAATSALRGMLVNGGWHLAVSSGRDIYERELMWLVGLRGPVGLRMLWKGYAFSTTPVGAPVCMMARLLRRGMWKRGRVVDPREWCARNDHGYRR